MIDLTDEDRKRVLKELGRQGWFSASAIDDSRAEKGSRCLGVESCVEGKD